MSSIDRTYSFWNDTEYRSNDIESEIDLIVNTWNNHDQGVSSWTVVKTSGSFTSTKTTNQIVLTPGANSITFTASNPASSRTYTIPDAGNNANVILSEGTKTINGAITLGSALNLNSNKITSLANGTAATDAAAFGQLKSNNIVGTTTNDNATAGNIGEYVETVSTSATPAASGVYNDAASISLTAGDWDISAMFDFISNGATWTQFITGVGTVTGNDSTGISAGENAVVLTIASTSTAVTRFGFVIPPYRKSLASTTTLYLKANITYSAGTPAYNRCRISARRVR